VIGTVNYRIGDKILPSKNTTPGFLDNQRLLRQLVDLNIDYCVMEASSHALDQGRLQGIDFSAGIFTNLTQDHLDYHKDMESYFRAKSLLFIGLSSQSHAIINLDDGYAPRLMALSQCKMITYGIDQISLVHARNINYRLSGTEFEIAFAQGVIKIHTNLIGRHNVYNILAAFAWGLSQNLDPQMIRRGIEQAAQVPGRLEAVENNKEIFIFIDYAQTGIVASAPRWRVPPANWQIIRLSPVIILAAKNLKALLLRSSPVLPKIIMKFALTVKRPLPKH
jgi:UDP-N-acetylmuramoyl-L-alanyl-D-glutamate--2,6-diaminopimelate ligase